MKIKKLFSNASKTLRVFAEFAGFLYTEIIQAFSSGMGGFVLKRLAFLLFKQVTEAKINLKKNLFEYSFPRDPRLKKLQKTVTGLHRLLPPDDRFSYSILIPVYKPRDTFLKEALESALSQSAPNMEVLVGFDGPQPDTVYQVVKELEQEFPNKLKSYQLDRQPGQGGISSTTNFLASKATGNYVLLMDHDDWLRPDLLYRYEQTLRLFPNPENSVISCNEYKIDENSFPIRNSGLKKADKPPFPYLFINLVCHCLLVPKLIWDRVGGLRSECDGAQDYDLVLRLNSAGANFCNVPCYLYAWRSHSESTAQNSSHKDYVIRSGIRSLEDYANSKQLNWKIEEGFIPTSYKIIPDLKLKRDLHVIIPFKDQKELTLNSVKSILIQQDVKTKITAIDNQSLDLTIKEELELLGVEVLSIKEPFNYSRLNNLAVTHSKQSHQEDILLFLNNDVELKPDCLLEMSRWIDQPNIGMVGCRLHYPNGQLQHGGIFLDDERPANRMNWCHTDAHQAFESAFMAKILHVADAVTAACSMIKRNTFIEIGGFDEIWYPIAYSDTNLAAKLKVKGLYCFYTPYAEGVHHESLTRGFGNIEDYEMSSWLQKNYESLVPHH